MNVVLLRTDVLWVKWINESWVMSQWVSESDLKNKSFEFGRNNKIKHYFYLIWLLASLLPGHARPISDMKSQPGLFGSSIPGLVATTTCMPRKIAFSARGGGVGEVLPYKGLMGTCSQPGYVFRDFCLKQGIEFIIFCLKQDIFSWTINSKIFTSSNVN